MIPERTAPAPGEPRGRTETSDGSSATHVLLRRHRQGDRDALEQLIQRNYPRVRAWVEIRMGPLLREKMNVEDIVQETFLSCLDDLADVEIPEDGHLIHYLATVAENQIRALAKREKSLKRSPPGRLHSLEEMKPCFDSSVGGYTPPSEDTSPSQRVSRKELVDIVHECAGKLSEDHQKVILLREIACCSWEYIAKEMKRESTKAVHMLHGRAITGLLKEWKRRAPGEPS